MGIDETKGGTICCQLGSGVSCVDWQWVTSIHQSYYAGKLLFIRLISPLYICSIKGSIFASHDNHGIEN